RLSFYAGLVYEKLNRHAKAASAYGDVPADSDLFHEARLHRASALSRAGQHKQAFELFKKGLTEKPDYLLLYPAYAKALERSGAGHEAAAFLQRSLAKRPSPEIVEALANLYERQGR